MKTNPGRFFEDYRIGDVIRHAVPRTVSGGERALYHALYPARHALYSSDRFAQACGLPASPLDDLIAFHVVFGKTVPDVSLNAVANLGYAEGRWLKPVYPGDTLRSGSLVVGGRARCRATAVGEAAWIQGLQRQARRFSLAHSELRAGIDRILRVVGWALLPTATLLFVTQFTLGLPAGAAPR